MGLDLTELGRILMAGRKKNEELSPTVRAAICGAIAAGATQRAVATAFGLSTGVITRTLQTFTTTGSFESKPRSGRPKVLTRRESRYITQLAKRKPHLTNKQLTQALGRVVPRSTVRRALREKNYRKWRAIKRIPLSAHVAKDRDSFARWALDNLEDLTRVGSSLLSLSRFQC
jgi:transposase